MLCEWPLMKLLWNDYFEYFTRKHTHTHKVSYIIHVQLAKVNKDVQLNPPARHAEGRISHVRSPTTTDAIPFWKPGNSVFSIVRSCRVPEECFGNEPAIAGSIFCGSVIYRVKDGPPRRKAMATKEGADVGGVKGWKPLKLRCLISRMRKELPDGVQSK